MEAQNGFTIKGIYVIKKWHGRLQVRIDPAPQMVSLKDPVWDSYLQTGPWVSLVIPLLNQACGQVDENALVCSDQSGPARTMGLPQNGGGTGCISGSHSVP